MTTNFITIHTKSPHTEDSRNVTLSHDTKTKKIILLGNLEHCTELEIDQELINNLQSIVNENKKV
jgi:hypothetical protein